MNLRPWFRALGSPIFAALFVSSASLFTPSAIMAQAPTTAVGTASAPQTATVTITTPGIAASISVLTQGSSSLDYAVFTPTVPVVGACTALTPYLAGATCTVQYTFTPTRPFTRYGAVAVFDASGNLLGNTFLTGVGTGPQVSYPLNASSAFSVLGSGFNIPYGVAVDASGNVYVADSQNNAVKEIVAVSGTVVTLASGFLSPAAVAVDGAGNVYVADSGHNAVKEIVAVNGTIPTTPTILTLGSGFSNPQGVAVDGSGNVYVADTSNSAVKQIAAVNGVIPASPTITSLSPAGSFVAPNAVAVDASGNVYVTDSPKISVREIVAVAGVVSATSSVVNLGTGLVNPQGVAVDGSGNVYVSDLGNNAIKEFVAVGGSVPTGSITIIPLGTGYKTPSGVAVDASGDVFVADGGNNAVEELNALTAPSLSFASTAIGATSTDSPKTVTVQNIGNAALSFPVPGTGTNPSLGAGFGIATGTTCPQLTASSTTPGSLAAGASCVYAVSFTPVSAGAIAGSVTSTDNNLNAAGATQAFTVSGTATVGTPVVTAGSTSAVVGSASVTLTASVAFAGVVPVGGVSFTVNGGAPVAANCTGSASPLSCSATYNPSALPVLAGGYAIVATIAADSNYATASGNGTLTITKGTPTLVLSPGSTSAVDATVTFTASVTPTSGIVPGGTVSFTTTLGGTTTTLCASIPIVAGTATCTTTALKFGSNSIGATLTADTNFFTASANAITQTVTVAGTTLALSSSQPTSSTVDSPVTFTATISATNPFTYLPTGTVAFSSGGTVISTCAAVTVSNHAASCTISSLVAPSDVITATYTTGDSNFTGSTAPALTQVVTRNTPTNSVVSTLTTAVVDQAVTFTTTITPATNSSAGVTPTGSVTFTKGSGGSTLCGGAVVVVAGANGTATATCSTPFLSTFSSTGIYAVYSGDQNFFAGNSPNVVQTVNAASTTTSVTSATNPSTVNQNVVLTAAITPANTGASFPGTAVPQSGTVTFTDSLTPTSPLCINVGTTLSGGVLTATCTYAFTASGNNHVITAAFTSSDPNFANSTTANSVTQSVSTSGTTLTVSNAGSPTLTVNQSGTFAATFPTFTTGQAVPIGTVSYYDSVVGGSAICTVTVTGTGAVPNCTETLLLAGTHIITAVYNPSNGSSFQTVTSQNFVQVVNQNTTTVTLGAITGTPVVDQQVMFSATLAPGTLTPAGVGTTVPTGSISFNAIFNGQTSTICTATLVSTGTSASCTAPLTLAGTYTLSVTYSGDSNFKTATSTPSNQVVAKTPTILGLITSQTLSSPAIPAVNQSAIYSVQLTLNYGIVDTNLTLPTGNVTFTDTTTNATCTAALNASAQASCAFAEPTANVPHTVVATYSGDANFQTSSYTQSENLVASGTSIAAASITTNPSSPTVNQTGVLLNATVTPTYSGATLPNGAILFLDTPPTGTPTKSCNATVTAGVLTPCSLVFATSGTHTITATFTPSDGNFSSSSASTTITIGSAGSITLGLTTSAPTVTVNQSATYTASFSPTQTGPTYPNGTVQFLDGGVAIPGCNVNTNLQGSGQIPGTIPTCTEVLSSAGTHVITATFKTNDANFTNLTSGNLAQIVSQGPTKTVLTAPTASSTVDQQVVFAGIVTPAALTPAGTGTALPNGSINFVSTANGVATIICAAPVTVATGAATCTAPFTASGAYSVTAVYNPGTVDTNFVASTSSAFADTVGLTGTSVSLISGSTLSNPASPAANQSASYSAQVSPSISDAGLTVPTGNITFLDSSTSVGCTSPINPSTGQATCSFTDTVPGVHSIVATYTGDSNFSTSKQTFTVTIGQSAATIPVSSIATNPGNPIVNQANVTLNAAITPGYAGTAPPTGTVLFTDTIGTVSSTCTSTVVTGVVAPCSHTFTLGGVHTITAAYSGDANFGATTASNTVTIAKAVPTISLTSSNPTSVGTQAVTFTATVTPSPSGPVAPTGAITFTSSPASVAGSCTPNLTSAGGIETAVCVVTFPATVSGNFVVTATYGGDLNYSGVTATSAPVASALTQVVQTFTVGVSPATITLPQGDTNLQDPYSNAAITLTQTNLNGYSDVTSYTCAVYYPVGSTTIANGLTCALGTAAGGVIPVTLTASATAAPGNYTVQFVASDTAAGHTTLIINPAETVSIVSTNPTVYVGAIGQVGASFTAPSGLTGLTCNQKVWDATTSTFTTLASAGIVCSGFTGGVAPSTSYSFTINAGTLTARLETGSRGPLMAVLGAPLLLMLGFLPATRRFRKTLLRGLAVLAAGIFLMQATGCSSGGFKQPQGTQAAYGTYLIQIESGTTPVAEVSLTVSN